MRSPKVTSYMRGSFEHQVAQREEAGDEAIHLSRLSGMAPADIEAMADFSRSESLLIIVRCPKRPARYFHGRYDPKPVGVKEKSDWDSGLVVVPNHLSGGRIYVSDYDLMSVWRMVGVGEYTKIPFSEMEPGSNVLHPEARALKNALNERLLSKLQHGAQDDFVDPKHPDITLASTRGHEENGKVHSPKLIDRFMVFDVGSARYFFDGAKLKTFYETHIGPHSWPYDANGHHMPSKALQQRG